MNTKLKSVLAQRLAKKGKKPNGFTLIELMIVVAILGLLTAVGLPELSKAQDRAKNAGAESTLTNAAKECAINLVLETAADAQLAHTAAIAEGEKFAGVSDKCEADEDMTFTSETGSVSTIAFDGITPGPVSTAEPADD
jgi:prepilin-type N-terminal cleavage/methylation domain-containing protein